MDNQKLFDEALKQLEKQFGKECLTDLGNEKKVSADQVIPTGSIQLDEALRIGGYPKGKIVEIYGNESCGKTTLALQAVASCQRQGGKCAYIDLEHSLARNYCEANGVDLSKLLLANPDSGEQAFELINALIKTGVIDLIVVDSVAAMTPQAEIDGKFDDQTIGLQARIMSKGLRIAQPLMTKYNTSVIFINQLRDKIGTFYGGGETTTGGRALRFYASVRIELRRSELLKEGNNCIGIRSTAKVVKNKVGAPLYKASIDFYFDQGIDHTMEIIDFALEHNVIVKKGVWYYFNDEKIGQGRINTKEYLLKNKDLFEQIKTAALNYQNKTEDIDQNIFPDTPKTKVAN